MSDFSTRLKYLRKKTGQSQQALATELNISKSSVNMYERGEREPNFETLEKIADYFNVDMNYLTGWSDDPINYDDGDFLASIPLSYIEASNGNVKQAWKMMQAVDEDAKKEPVQSLPLNCTPVDFNKLQKIPLLGQVAAGLPLYAEENIEGYTYTELNGGAEYFALRVKGDSMDAMGIKDGYIVIVRRQSIVEDGEVAVVMVDDENATMKRFYRADRMVTLLPQSNNPEHKPQIYDLAKTKVEVIGKVVKVEFML